MTSSSLPESKLIAGDDIEGAIIKYLASLRRKTRHFCSGCMISERHILTGAQCITKLENEHPPDFCNYSAFIGETRYEIERVNYHHNYKNMQVTRTRIFDVGLVLVGLLISFHLSITSSGNLKSFKIIKTLKLGKLLE